MTIWRYCPNCFRLADSSSVLKFCPMNTCKGRPNSKLQVLPLDHEAAQAALRIGGAKALEEMIVGLVAGEDAAQAYEAELEPYAEWEQQMHAQIRVKRPPGR